MTKIDNVIVQLEAPDLTKVHDAIRVVEQAIKEAFPSVTEDEVKTCKAPVCPDNIEEE